MNKQDKIKELEKTITDAQAEIEALNKSKRYKPKDGERYFYKSQYEVSSTAWEDDDTDNRYYKSGNCYRTREEAQRAYDRDVLLTKVWDDCDFDADWGDDEHKFEIYYCHENRNWHVFTATVSKSSFTFPHYQTMKDATPA